MKYTYRFQKVLELKENEKEKSLEDYNRSVTEFEKAAEKLYDCLKKKEVLEERTARELNTGMPVQEIRHFQQFVTNLEKTITHYQRLVVITRDNMQERQLELTEKNIEVKKYEKMKEKHYEVHLEHVKASESKFMDDLSIQAFALRGN
ncbi:flagellar biosynthesis chaperone FliJ [Metabacillus idriensis]|uniref:Flagellar FliJ protein n=1 Tax=Metabacillus idriensis TaxID=324768 RepID=A0A6I2M706_9BACI|nr:flagellar export protein FliJ [Metabacillus idriensis]MCM3594300.1 flagellar biosynthesis chaperone FliJ [Metabacillus idriensis]MRX53669.1 flagellar biosynthesis chaperone FliJ [Metabacillus idriensis]OHR64863.1 flagellar biosynthesis chaperone [Bacillus sp. HMSC76G11]